MALFNRKKKDDALVERLVAELTKANNMATTPMGGAGYTTATAAQPSMMQTSGGQGLIQTPGMQANPLPRPSTSFGSQLGPAAPFLPAPLDPVFDDSGRALPRLWEYPVAWNLDLNQRSTPWSVLRSMADQIDIIHRAIEIKISEITKMGWSFEIENSTITSIMAEQNCSHAKAARIARDTYSKDISTLREFWENPYPQLGRTFTEWMTEFLWQHFVFDGTPVYPRYNLGKKVTGFEIVDAPTIKVLLNNRGAMPEPPSPAFQQVLWGFPRGEYQFTPNSDGEFFNAPGKNDEFLRDQLAYFVRNRRTWSPYGFSAVEEAVPAATLYLDRQQWMKAEYRDGATPMAFFETDSEEMDPTHLAAFERVFNDRLMGSTTERHRMKVLPRGFKPIFAPTIDERYKNEYDEFIILRISTIFGVAPGAMGVVPRSGLGGSGEHKGQAQTALTTSQKPLEAFLIETINTLSRRFLGSDKNITFSFEDDDSDVSAMTARAQAFQVSLQSGQMTINDVRGELNMPLYDIEEADEPFIVAGQTIQFLSGLLEQSKTNTEETNNDQVASGPSGDNSNVTQEGAQSKEGQGPVVQPQGRPTQTPLEQKSAVVEEVKEFARFVKSRHKRGNWRAFEFVTVPQDVAESLNEQAYFITKGVTPMPDVVADWAIAEAERLLGDNTKGLAPSTTKRSVDDLPAMKQKRAIEEHYADQIADALGDSLSGIDQAISIAIKRLGEKAASDPIVAIRGALKFNPKPLTDVLGNVYMEAGYVATAYAVRELGDGANLESELAQAASAMNWDAWTPGSPLTASKLAKGGLKTELDNLGYTLKGIGDTTISRIGNAIASGVTQGLPAKSIARDISGYVRDPARAMTIATTETNRAYSLAALDQYQATGTKQWEWLAYDDACPNGAAHPGPGPFCSELAGVYDMTNSQTPPPLHPNCRCSVAAVVSTQ